MSYFEHGFRNTSRGVSDKMYIKGLFRQVSQIITVDWTNDDVFEYNSTSDFVELLKFETLWEEAPFQVHSATFNGNKLDFAMVLTTQVFGRAFNLMEQSKLLELNV